MTTRADVAVYLADAIRRGEGDVAIQHAAAWLSSTGRKHQADYLARDVAALLERDGYTVVSVETAHPLSDKARDEVISYVKGITQAKDVELTESIRPELIGGMRLTTPTAELDTSVQHRLQTFAKGVF